jgi:hypothetical protein
MLETIPAAMPSSRAPEPATRSRLCPTSGRVLSAVTATKISFPDGRTIQTVVEVTSEGE